MKFRFRPCAHSIAVAAALALALAAGCGRQAANLPAASAGTATADEASSKLPFDQPPRTGISPGGILVPSGAILPAGASITIRLASVVSSASSRAGDTFDAVLDEPIVVAGKTVAPLGTRVRGRVIAAKASGPENSPAYLRITLAAITINGRTLPLETSSVLIKAAPRKRRLELVGDGDRTGALIGAVAEGGKGTLAGSAITGEPGRGEDVAFERERRLTFRVTPPEPAHE
jgi:hypothetical protein